MAYQPSPAAAGASLPPLSRPQLAEARRVRAVELFEDGVSNAEIAQAVGACAESVRRWRRAWEKGGASALRRRAATVVRPSWTTSRSRPSGPRWKEEPKPMVSRPTCGPWSES
ncbi:helix-turn-helix domain-containing protein, partial [Streptomyces sp. NPDC088748]|uniref:helix-turn-helix domain-containing protein n=1 Tax=Streptomyces sp. NPDC088748 TaxID=3365887 RepID=UPI0038125499